MDYMQEKIRVIVKQLGKLCAASETPLDGFEFCPAPYKTSNQPPNGPWKPWHRSDSFSGKDEHFWFHCRFTAPQEQENRRWYFQLETGCNSEWEALKPQGLVYLNGEMCQGLDINHRHVLLEAGRDYDMYVYMYAGSIPTTASFRTDIVGIDEPTENLYYDLKVPLDASQCIPRDSEDCWKILKALESAVQLLDLRKPYNASYYDSVDAARKFLKDEFFRKDCGASAPTVHCVGHTHIDVAWMWTLAQTREKAQRSFSTVLRLMEQYPEYKFMSSQPQLYQYVKEAAPEIYAQIQERVREGRWEVEGAMWLEADCNLTSGESLVRQILHGKKFMRQEFGADSHILWLPDVFGYSAAMPQILRKAGIDSFFTTKISWSETNKMPYDAFLWQGIDGSEVFTSFGTAQDLPRPDEDDNFTTYNGTTEPTMVMGTWRRFQQKEYSGHTIISFGYGDGGGGPTRHQLETQRRTAYGLPGIPRTKISTTNGYFSALKKDFRERASASGRAPKWVGELYMEYHRGTYTSIAKNKRNNRKSELLYQKVETLSVLANLLCGERYPADELYSGWQIILLNQFHDIIPGSSIHEVYEECDRQYADILAKGSAMAERALSAIASRVPGEGLLVYNPLGFVRSGMVSFEGKTYWAEDVPAMGWKVIAREEPVSRVVATASSLENSCYRLTLDHTGTICSLFDKRAGRELCLPGRRLNELQVFEDFPRAWDAWELSAYYKDKMWVADRPASVEIVAESVRKGLRIVKPYEDSVITQTIYLYDNLPRIDFETEVDWHQRHQILKAAFPLDLRASQASYEIQFGHVVRPTHSNTSWDAAKFEVCAHKWADLSENDYGVALLNDCKYGHSAEDSTLKLSLLKSATYPDPEADQGLHRFTYSLLPHMGDLQSGDVVNQAYDLNQPLMAAPAASAGKGLPERFSLVSCDRAGVILETVKQAEDGDGLILRFYEAFNRRGKVTFTLGIPFSRVSVCDLMEKPVSDGDLTVSGSQITVPIKNFEIVTLRVQLS